MSRAGVGAGARVAILWGSGLGDVLVMRPLIESFCRRGDQVVYFTRGDRCRPLFEALALPVRLWVLPPHPAQALKSLRAAGTFDWVYTGPGSGWPTRLLCHGVRRSGPEARVVVSRRKAFVADGIVQDLVALGLAHEPPPPYGSLPLFPGGPRAQSPGSASPYLLLHPGARSDWRTKSWPATRWQRLVQSLCAAGWSLDLVGTAEEREGLESLVPRPVAKGAVDLRIGDSLAGLERAVAHAAGVICHNSGVMHLALAHRRPTVVLTGSSAHQWRAPYPRVFNLGSGRCHLACNRRHCPVPGFRARCIRLLTLDAVVETCLSLWGESREPTDALAPAEGPSPPEPSIPTPEDGSRPARDFLREPGRR